VTAVMAAVMAMPPAVMVAPVMMTAPAMAAVVPAVMLVGGSARGPIGGCAIARWVRVARLGRAGDEPRKKCN